MAGKPLTVADIGEVRLLRRLAACVEAAPAGTLGIGDDAAVIARPRTPLLLTTDSMVEGTHFTRDWFRPEELGYKALAANLSDAAAMGGRPVSVLVSLVLPPDTAVAAVERLYRGMNRLARAEGVSILGGNVARGPGVEVTISLIGDFPRGKPFRRAGARPGDRLYVSGQPGLAYLGYRLLAAHRSVDAATGDPWSPPPRRNPAWRERAIRNLPAARRAVTRFLKPEARLALSRALRARHPSACIDVSDGVGTDLLHLAQAGLALLVHEERLPASRSFRALAETLGEDAAAAVLHGGEDYELLFTLPPREAKRVGPRATLAGVPVTEIGEVIEGPGRVLLRTAGRTRRLSRTGFHHFMRK